MYRCFVIVASRKIRSVITDTYQYDTSRDRSDNLTALR